MNIENNVKLQNDRSVLIDGVKSQYTWRKFNGQMEMWDAEGVHRVSNTCIEVFCRKILDFHRKIGEFEAPKISV